MKNKRKVGLSEVFHRKHICLFYGFQKDLLELAVPYFREGLRNNDLCMWVVSDSLGIKGAKEALSMEVKNVDAYIKKGQLEILDYRDWYVKEGKFIPNRVLKGWAEKEKQALKQGFMGLRLSGDITWVTKTNWKKWIDYEKKVDRLINKNKMTALCTYPLNKLDLSGIFILSTNHRFAFSNLNGQWHILKNISLNNVLENIRFYLKDYNL